jgi:hypothetical protein
VHLNHLYKIITTDLKPAYYFRFDRPTGKLTMKVLEFNLQHGGIYKSDVFPFQYFSDGHYNQKQGFITKRKYKLFMKRLKAI